MHSVIIVSVMRPDAKAGIFVMGKGMFVTDGSTSRSQRTQQQLRGHWAAVTDDLLGTSGNTLADG